MRDPYFHFISVRIYFLAYLLNSGRLNKIFSYDFFQGVPFFYGLSLNPGVLISFLLFLSFINHLYPKNIIDTVNFLL